MKKIALALAALALAASALAQNYPQSCTVVIAAGQSDSAVFGPSTGSPTCGMMGENTAVTPLVVFPPSAFTATTDGINILACKSAAGTSCLPLSDYTGATVHLVMTTAKAVQVAPGTVGGVWWMKLRTVTSGDVAVVQASDRTFTLLLRPL